MLGAIAMHARSDIDIVGHVDVPLRTTDGEKKFEARIKKIQRDLRRALKALLRDHKSVCERGDIYDVSVSSPDESDQGLSDKDV